MDRMTEVGLIIYGLQHEIKFHSNRIKKTGDWEKIKYHSHWLKTKLDWLGNYIEEYNAIVKVFQETHKTETLKMASN